MRASSAGARRSRKASSRRRSPPRRSMRRCKPRRARRRSARHRSAVASHVPRDARLRPQGIGVAGISAIDIALWDLAGKAHGVPVHQLLGGAFRTRVQAYATGFYRIAGQGEASRLADEAIAHHEAGFRAMKVKLGYGLADDLAVMAAVGRAIEGRGVTLMVDTNHAYGVRRRRAARPRARAVRPALVRGAGGAGAPRRYREVRQSLPDADRGRRERAHPLRLPRVPRGRRRRHRATGHRLGGRLHRLPARRRARAGARRAGEPARLGLGRSRRPRRCS